MGLIADSFSSLDRPVLTGRRGAIAAAHPLAVAAGQEMLFAGGGAVDAAIAAQAVLCVVAPDACGLGGDMLALIRDPTAGILAVNGSGAAPAALDATGTDGATSITVPGIVAGWISMHQRWGRLPLRQLLDPALRLAQDGLTVSESLARTVTAHRARLTRGGADRWSLFGLTSGQPWQQPELARLLQAIGREGAAAFYEGAAAAAIERAVQSGGGALRASDLAQHVTPCLPALEIEFGAVRVAVQPPITQGVLLAMVLRALEKLGPLAAGRIDHTVIELTEAAFEYRSRCAQGAQLLAQDLPIDLARAARRGGPRAYLHTAGVAAADAAGLVVSSLVSVFDDFGSCVFVPELGITLNNRAGGFTDGANAAAPGKRPVHTLAPALIVGRFGAVAFATPGADGQVQTLAQVIERTFRDGQDLAAAIAAPRWRSEGGELLVEEGHPAMASLAALGHRLRPLPAGDLRFGAVVCAGFIDGAPVAAADWRRETWSGIA